MAILAWRKKLILLLLACGAVIALSYGFAGYLFYKRNHPLNSAEKPSPPSGTQQVETLLNAADECLRNHKVEQALLKYREALSLDPRSLKAQLALADGEFIAGREEVAAREYERVLKLDRKNRSALLQLARIASHQSNTWPKAEARYKEYLEANPNDAHAGLGLARVMAWRGKAGEAAALFGRRDVMPLMTTADRRDYAFALVKSGHANQAEPILKTLLAADPGDTKLGRQLADIYAARQDWNAALPIYRALLRQRPNDPQLNFSYGQGLMYKKSYSAALGPLGKARNAMPANGEAGLAYARAWKGSGDLKKAVREYERVMPSFHNRASVLREYADVLLEKRDYKKSATYYAAAYDMGVRDNRLLLGLAGALSGRGKYKAALPYLEEAYRRSPNDRVKFELAKVLWKLKGDDSARDLLRQVETSQHASRLRQPAVKDSGRR